MVAVEKQVSETEPIIIAKRCSGTKGGSKSGHLLHVFVGQEDRGWLDPSQARDLYPKMIVGSTDVCPSCSADLVKRSREDLIRRPPGTV